MSLTPEEADAIAAVETACPWLTPGDVLALVEAPDDQRKEMLLEYKLAGVAPSANTWTALLTILGAVATLAGAVTGIAGAVGAVYSIAKL